MCFLRDFFLRASTVETAESKFGIDEYSDVIMLAKPVIYISAKEVCSTHQVSTVYAHIQTQCITHACTRLSLSVLGSSLTLSRWILSNPDLVLSLFYSGQVDLMVG